MENIKIKVRDYLNKKNAKQDYSMQIAEFFWENPNPKDDAIHTFSEKLGVDTHEFESYIYSLLSDLIHLKSSEHDEKEFDKDQINMGIKIEMEHVGHIKNKELSSFMATQIAKAHLVEDPKYYTHLQEMEDKYKS